MTTPSSAIIDSNAYRVGDSRVPSVDVAAAAILKKWPVSDCAVFGWSAGVAFQGLSLSPAQSGEYVSKFFPTVGVRTHFAFAYRFLAHLKFFTSLGVGAHVGMMSGRQGPSVVTELEGVGHFGLMFTRIPGLPESITPMIQGIGGVGVFHPEAGPLTYVPLYGGGLGVLWVF